VSLEVEEAHARIGDRVLFGPLSFRIERGQRLTLLGPSGSGKSTLLRYISGTSPKAVSGSGVVRLNGRRIDSLRAEHRRVGIVFQQAALFSHLSVADNLLFARPAGGTKAERRAAVLDALDQVGILALADQMPDALSGGERARAALVRTLIAEPEGVLLDEPFSALDKGLRKEIRELTFQLIRDRELPALLVTHDEEDAGGGPVLTLKLS
jgi:putative thiamine transport system ATP-binding protein